MPDERRTLEELSAAQNRPTSSVARMIYLERVEQYRSKVSDSADQQHSS